MTAPKTDREFLSGMWEKTVQLAALEQEQRQARQRSRSLRLRMVVRSVVVALLLLALLAGLCFVTMVLPLPKWVLGLACILPFLLALFADGVNGSGKENSTAVCIEGKMNT